MHRVAHTTRLSRIVLAPTVLGIVTLCLACQGPAAQQPAQGPERAALSKPSFDDLPSLIPADVSVYVEGPGARWVDDNFGILPGVEPMELAGALVAEQLGVSKRAVATFLKAILNTGLAVRWGEAKEAFAVFVRVSHAAAVEPLLEQDLFKPDGKASGGARRYQIVAPDLSGEDGEPMVLHWYPEARLLLAGSDSLAQDIGGVLSQGKPSLRNHPRFQAARAEFESEAAANAYVDVASLFDEGEPRQREVLDAVLSKRTPLTASITFQPVQRLSVRFGLSGSALPPTALDAPAASLTLPSRLPLETVGYLAFSSRFGLRGRRLLEALAPTLALLELDAPARLQDAAAELGVSTESLLALLGDQGVIASIAPDKLSLPAGAEPADAMRQFGVLFVQQLSGAPSNEATLQTLLARLSKELRGKHRVRKTKTGLVATPRAEEGLHMEIAQSDGHLLTAFGAPALTKRAIEAFRTGKRVLGEDQAYRQMSGQLKGARLALWVDTERLVGLIPDGLGGNKIGRRLALLNRLSGSERMTGAMALQFGAQDGEWKVQLDLYDAATVGMLAAVAIYGVRRYLASAKVSEAKNVIAAIGRGALAAHEMERAPSRKSRLCASARPVPAVGVPRGSKHQPSSRPGEDFQQGDTDTGWPCLRFALTEPHYFRYHYNAGGNYFGPAQGGPDPGPGGFEVAAEGDLDGDGETSLFTIIGQLDRKTGSMTLSPKMFIVNEFE